VVLSLSAMELGVDEWCFIATHVINKVMSRKRIQVNSVYSKLYILCSHSEYKHHLHSEMKRLYVAIHASWHRTVDEIFKTGLETWGVKVFHPFRFAGEKRCSVLFKNSTTSCLIGFLVQDRNLRTTFFGVETFYETRVFPPLQDSDVICPVFRK
jgi:hypothetical protein